MRPSLFDPRPDGTGSERKHIEGENVIRSIRLVPALILTLALVAIAGCGGNSSATEGGYGAQGGTDTTAEPTVPAGPPAEVSVASAGDIGDVLVDGDGMTLYRFEADTDGVSSCYETCEAVWPPLLTGGDSVAGDGADSSLLGTTERQDGITQVTYDSWPLYTFDGDTKAGQANGNGLDTFEGEWYAMHADGSPAEAQP